MGSFIILSTGTDITCTVLYCSFGLTPGGALQVRSPLPPNQSCNVSLPLSTQGGVMKMDPLNNLQVGATSGA